MFNAARLLFQASVLMLVSSGATAANDTHYFALFQDRVPVGELQIEQQTVGGTVETREDWTILVRSRHGSSTVALQNIFRESESGRPLSWHQEGDAGGERIRQSLHIGANRLSLFESSNGVTQSLKAPANLRFPAALANHIERSAQANEPASISLWSPSLIGWREVVIALIPDSNIINWTEKGQQTQVLWHRPARRPMTNISLLGVALRVEPCGSKPCNDQVSALDLFGELGWQSPYTISRPSLDNRIRYLLAGPKQLLALIPTTSTQQVQWAGQNLAVTVCAKCSTRSDKERPASELSTPTPWIQADAVEIRTLVREAKATTGSAMARMRRLEQHVRRHMSGPVSYFGYLSAREAARRRSGDCTEAALLLAAAGRAAGVPTRIVAGTAYASRFTGRTDIFSPHMWVQAWGGDGWMDFDSGLGSFSAGHIALTIGDGSPSVYAGTQELVRHIRILDAASLPSTN